jgi:N-acetylmuramic acid 6-phosphate etherase
MIKLGKVYKNLMVDLQAKNLKLKERCVKIVNKATNVDRETATDYLQKTDYDVKLAIFLIKSDLEINEAKKVLKNYDGHLSEAIKSVNS